MLCTNQRLTYSHSYSEKMNIKSLNCRDVNSDHKIKYKHTENFKKIDGGDDKIKSRYRVTTCYSVLNIGSEKQTDKVKPQGIS